MQKKGYLMALVEPALKACRNAEKRGLHAIVCGTLGRNNVEDCSVEQIFMLDVLEHIKNDVDFLKLIHEKLVPGGCVLLTVPAFQALWSSEDDAAGHFRRYTLGQIKKEAEQVGFSVLYGNYFFSFLYFPILIVRVGMEKIGLLKKSGERTMQERKDIARKQFKVKGRGVQSVLNMLEKMELQRLVGNKKVCFGSSIICVLAKK